MISADSEEPPIRISHDESKVPNCWLFSSPIIEDNTIVSVCFDAKIIAWDLESTREPVKQITPHHVSAFRGLQLTSDSSHLLFLRSKHFYVWNFFERKLINILSIKEKKEMKVMTLASGDQMVLVACDNHTIQLIDLKTFCSGDSISISHEQDNLFCPLIG